MTAGICNLIVEQGATFLEDFLLEDDEGILDLTGCRAAMQVRAAIGDPTAVLTLTTENGGLVLGGPAGTIAPVFDTDALVPGQYVYDLKLIDSGGEVFRLLQGSFCVSGEVTTIV
jgi:hypothetical protein